MDHEISRRTVLRGAAASAAALTLCGLPDAAFAAPASVINPGYDHRYDKYVVKSAAGFTHPGVLLSRAQLNLMRDMVQRGYQPWARTFELLRREPHSFTTYQAGGPLADASSTTSAYTCLQDAMAAFQLALMWYITGDPAYATRSIGLIDAWSVTMVKPPTDWIRVGQAVQRWMAAAEILRFTPSSGWTEANTGHATAFVGLLLPSINIPTPWMNQSGYATDGTISAAVFLDDAELYRTAVNRLTAGDNPNPLIDVAIARQIWATGQVQEMGRDQAHANGTVVTLALAAQTALIQGKDLGGGADMFDYLGRRLLRGFEYYTKFNLGHDVDFEALDPDGNAGYYQAVALGGRGTLGGAYDLIYNHYRYAEHLDAERLPYVARAHRVLGPEGGGGDFPGFGALLYSQPAAREHTPPLGPPKPLDNPGIDPRFQRLSGADYAAVRDSRRDYFTDADGSRAILADTYSGSWVRYDDIDFGAGGADTLLLRAGVNSSIGAYADVRLDSVTGELLGTGRINATGWYTVFQTTATKLARAVTGTHTVYLVFHGSDNVYGYQGDVDWFKFARGGAQLPNQATAATSSAGAAEVDNGRQGAALRLAAGAWLTFADLDFDNGALSLTVRISSTAAGTLELLAGGANGAALAGFGMPDTGGLWQTVSRAMSRDALYGRNDITLVNRGSGPLLLDTFQFSSGLPPFAAVDGAGYYDVITGAAGVLRERDGATCARIHRAGTVLSYPQIAFSGAHQLSAVVASRTAGTIEVRTVSPANKPLAVVEVPPTGGSRMWRAVNFDLAGATRPLPDGMVFLTFTGVDGLRSYQLDPPNRPSPVIDLPATPRWLVGEPLSFPVGAHDPGGSATGLRSYRLPAGASYDAAAGTFSWTPGAAQTGPQEISFLADNGTTMAIGRQTPTVYATADAAIEAVTAGVNTSTYTGRSVRAYQDAVADARRAAADPSIGAARLVSYVNAISAAVANFRTALPVGADGKLDTRAAATVTASQASWDGKLQPADAGKPAFDGDLTTFVDLRTSVSFIQADFGAGNEVALTRIRAYPRAGQTKRLDNARFIASNDAADWLQLAAVGGTASSGWNTMTVTDTTTYRYLRMVDAVNADVAEVEFYGDIVDKALLRYAVTKAGLLDPTAYTDAAWSALTSAVRAAAATDAATTVIQVDVDVAAQAVLDAIAGLVARK